MANLVVSCSHCNRIKSGQLGVVPMTLAELVDIDEGRAPVRPPLAGPRCGAGRVSTPSVPPPNVPAPPPAGARFLTLDQVAEQLTVSRAQVYAFVRDRSLVALKIGGRGVWRVERSPAGTPVDDPADELVDQDSGPGEPSAA